LQMLNFGPFPTAGEFLVEPYLWPPSDHHLLTILLARADPSGSRGSVWLARIRLTAQIRLARANPSSLRGSVWLARQVKKKLEEVFSQFSLFGVFLQRMHAFSFFHLWCDRESLVELLTINTGRAS